MTLSTQKLDMRSDRFDSTSSDTGFQVPSISISYRRMSLVALARGTSDMPLPAGVEWYPPMIVIVYARRGGWVDPKSLSAEEPKSIPAHEFLSSA